MIQAVPAQGTPAVIPLHAIETAPQIRTRNGFDETGLRELAESIRHHGILQPVLVAALPDASGYRLVAGERRLLAASLAGLTDVPATVVEGNAGQLAAMQAVENLQRQDLTLLDMAEGLKALAAVYPKPKDLCRAIGKSQPWLSKHLRLTKLKPAVMEAVAEGLGDLETITALDGLARINTLQAQHLLTRCLQEHEQGLLTRALARQALASAKKVGVDDGEGDDEGDGHGGADTSSATPLKLRPDLAAWLHSCTDGREGQVTLPAGVELDALRSLLKAWAEK